MAIIDNVDYHKIIKYRRDSERLFDLLLDNDSDSYNVMLHSVVALFIIDYDNITKDFFDEKNMNYIIGLTNDFIDNDRKSLKLSNKELTNIMDIYNKGKINYNMNKSLVIKFASLYNDECTNSLMRINIESLENLCDSFK